MGNMQRARVIGYWIGRAIARDVIQQRMPIEWTGIEPADGDHLMAAGIEPKTPEWVEAERIAEVMYYEYLSSHNYIKEKPRG